MHLGFDAAPTVIATPSSPQRAAEVFASPQRFVARHGAGSDRLPRLRILARWDDSMGATIGDRIMAFSGVAGAVGGDTADLLLRRDLTEKIGQHRRIADMAPGDLDGPNFQRLFVDPEVDLTPDPPFWTAMFAGVPLAFALHLDDRVRTPGDDPHQLGRAAVGDIDRVPADVRIGEERTHGGGESAHQNAPFNRTRPMVSPAPPATASVATPISVFEVATLVVRLVSDIVAGIELVLEAVRVRREESEERERQWKELQRRRRLAKARKEREERRLSHLQRIVDPIRDRPPPEEDTGDLRRAGCIGGDRGPGGLDARRHRSQAAEAGSLGDEAAAVLLPVPAADAGAQVRRRRDASLPGAAVSAEGRPACPREREADPRLHRRADSPA